ncbi:competence protein ComEC [Clostridium tetanomorphum]|uniref:MBL fold metallo-hydrolase n=1 Tax=Clostridium tetanomorphum TaxID=1553 RepID=A0A923EDE1_CLOTT|nr:ComEC/Rec2 family competence protein [Clostridium tetanomorphum]KAJ50284.1 hydrolase [Clostridium tetanomorphum DSM 665]MBC2400011.1 MBL fold metallo-hydrolase [Clostridium tetanomorphum]MBP1864549.1 competence protein ComEC [Clostridium tetanomorphum]NRS82919.1 competence protein ComEC [Clostridium tetanomorphum]NRZ98985.1 competence protein ComEC [Clostridium tetanomorphum]
MNKKKIFILFLIIIYFIPLKACSSYSFNNISNDNILKIHYIDIGQGDSILISINNKHMLIDSGSKEKSKYLIKYLKNQKIKKLNYVIATHPHEDHIGSMSEIIRKFTIENFYAPKITSNNSYFNDMVNALIDNNLKIKVAKANNRINFYPNIYCEFIAPNNINYDNINNYSAVLKLTYKNCSFIFTGDAEALSENEMIQNCHDLKCDVLKLGHHGSSTSTTDSFLEKTSPKIAIVSCGKNNKFGHPNKKTISKIKKKNIKLYRTDIDGNIVFTCDGKGIQKLIK